MRDEHGLIPVGALYLANLFRRQQLAGLLPGHAAAAQFQPASFLGGASWTSRGPQNVGGRTRAFLINPNNKNIMYAGAVSGGVWKSTNAGTTWTPLSDFMSNLAVMTMAFDPTDATRNTIYVGTGERTLRGDGIQGAGVLKTTDGGNTWIQLATTATWDTVPRVAVSSTGAILAGVRRGIFLSTNGGTSWTQTFICSDALGSANGVGLVVAFDPFNASKAVAEVVEFDFGASTWRHKILYSTDGGAHWINSVMPSALTDYNGHVELAYAPSQTQTIYANVGPNATGDLGEIWRSTDGGQTFVSRTTQGVTHCTFGACGLWVSPTDPNFLLIGGSTGSNGAGGLTRSTDGGTTVASIGGLGWGEILSGDVHADQHCMVESPAYAADHFLYVCTDAGIFRTSDAAGATIGAGKWTSLNGTYQTSQYHGADGNGVSGAYVGGTQDNGTLSTSRLSSDATLVAGGDGGLAAIDPTDPTYYYAEFQFLDLYRARSGVSPNTYTLIGRNGGFHPLSDSHSSASAAFVGPFALDPRDANGMLAAGLSVWRSRNIRAPAPDWERIRTAGNAPVVALAVSKSNANVVWIAEGGAPLYPFGNGTISRTVNATAASPTWATVRTAGSVDGLPQLPATSIYIDPSDSNVVYLTFGDFNAGHLWRTRDGGSSWASASGSGLTALPPAPARAIVSHPRNSNVLFVGTDVGLYESDDAGSSWSPIAGGPEEASVYDLRFVYGSDELLIATHGRGLWSVATDSVPTYAPAHLVATASGTSAVTVSWQNYPGAASYILLKSSGGAPYFAISGVTSSPYSDTNVSAETTYLYKVRAVVAGVATDASNVDLATTTVFTDDNSLPSKRIRATHLQEIRDAANHVRAAAGLPPVSFGALTSSVTPVRASDITDVRAALVAAYYSIGLPIPAFVESLAAGATLLKAQHYQEVRNLVK